MARGPAVDARVRGFMALAVDMVRVDAERRPSPEMAAWYRELAEVAGLDVVEVSTSRELLKEGLRIARAVRVDAPATSAPRRASRRPASAAGRR